MNRPRSPREIAALSLGALGVVYGDIGTSPLYTIRECVYGPHAVAVNEANIYGILSLVLWSLILVVALKYLVFILRADNEGEGGILALFALVASTHKNGQGGGRKLAALLMLGIFGAGLLYGDGVITPVISILGAMEGLGVRVPALQPAVVPITIGILVGLFLVQRHGSGPIGRWFGLVMLVWFTVLATTGLIGIARHPEVLAAVNPIHGVRFMTEHGWHGFFLLGAVFLAVTGSEALYADMGHFGKTAIRIGWFALVMPALVLNYFGQGALVLAEPSAAENPFYAMAPGWTLYPMLILATMAAIIASQALISGVFSVTRQAMQLGYWPRLRVLHTSAHEEGQIYIPEMNYFLMVGCIALTIGFGSSSAIAAAYGIAVTGTMIITSLLFWVVARRLMGWSAGAASALVGLFLVIDVAFFAANAVKIGDGGWFPLAMGLSVFIMMTTWYRGRQLFARRIAEESLALDLFLADIGENRPYRVPGTSVFMTSNVGVTPGVLLHYFKHSKVLHRNVVLFTVHNARVPKIPADKMVAVRPLAQGFWQVVARVGFMQDPDVPAILEQASGLGLEVDLIDVSYYLGRETLLTGGRSPMARWRKALFAFLSRNARPATQFFHLPPNRVVEIGAQIEL
ncbi:MAG TPA: potassium transporter Kup [Kofleriaceae bacterium]|nr:potassium transporter Kup [Kofleriaceae bacterium]